MLSAATATASLAGTRSLLTRSSGDAPLIFCTPNIADNRHVAILLTQTRSVNLDKDAGIDLAMRYEELRLRVVNDPAGQSSIVHLFLQLFVLHILGARPECVAQPKHACIKPRDWLTDGAAASLTSLGSMMILAAASGEMEASGRGSLHGQWEFWGRSNASVGSYASIR